jgi:hypothetical protein
MTGDNYDGKMYDSLVFMAFSDDMETSYICADHYRAYFGHNIGIGIDDCRNRAFYDCCWYPAGHSDCHTWFFIDDKEHFLAESA